MSNTDEKHRLEIIRDILKVQPFQHPLIQLAIGTNERDDCAVYDFPGNLSLLVGTDFIRGPGFRLYREGLLDYYDLGYYLIVANLSDIAAMGGTPIGITTIVRYDQKLSNEDFAQLFEGMKEAAEKYHTPIVGGDIGGYQETVLAATAFGVTRQGKYLRREGTKVGDLLCLTGIAGLPSTALAYFTRAKGEGFLLTGEEEQRLLNAWKRPVAQIPQGALLAESGFVHACQDVSDGVKATVEQLGWASGVSFELQESEIEIDPITKKVAEFLKVDEIALAFSASVDFNLMFTVSQEEVEALRASFDEFRIIGIAIPASEGSRIVSSKTQANEAKPIPGVGWNQQNRDITEVILHQS